MAASVLRFSSKTAELGIDGDHVSSRDVIAFDNTTARDDKTADQTILNELIVRGFESVATRIDEAVLHKQPQVTLLDNLREQSSHHSATICVENANEQQDQLLVGKLAEGLLWHRAQLAKEDRDELLCELRGLKVGRFEIGDDSVKTVGSDDVRRQRSVANLLLQSNWFLFFAKNLGVLRFNSADAVTEDAAEDEAVARETLELDSNIVVELKSTNFEIDHGRTQAQFDLKNGTVLVDGALFAFEELMNGQSNLIMKNIRIETSIFSKFIDKLIKILVVDLFSNVSSNEAGHLQSGGGERIFSHWEACRMGCEA